ncbi:hypothetical protein EDE08_103480 [Bradyrhizobium sp. R2.2-H]|jgi:hypothetical protein|nr:hypothetical protein EDE10_103479 [Bradyrhizobium sp. Y-H1]TCU78028.1 hypothetical protein EDE08_103480 [Bradyrhizobium sp. R2.2-H]
MVSGMNVLGRYPSQRKLAKFDFGRSPQARFFSGKALHSEPFLRYY